jgi:hypothetical protein
MRALKVPSAPRYLCESAPIAFAYLRRKYFFDLSSISGFGLGPDQQAFVPAGSITFRSSANSYCRDASSLAV